MSITSYFGLLRLVADGAIRPVLAQDVNGSSIDVRLGSVVLAESCPGGRCVLELGKRDQPMLTVEHDISKEPFTLAPGQFVLAHTAETFNLPLDYSAEFRLKSSAARMGLSHALAVWCDPGWHGSSLTMELHNISQYHHIVLRAGAKIGQMIFHHHPAVPHEISYAKRGAYNNDAGPSAAKPARIPNPAHGAPRPPGHNPQG